MAGVTFILFASFFVHIATYLNVHGFGVLVWEMGSERFQHCAWRSQAWSTGSMEVFFFERARDQLLAGKQGPITQKHL